MQLLKTLQKAWAVLLPRERRQAKLLMLVLVLAAASSALMVGSILPFLIVLGDPTVIQTNGVLRYLYDVFGFTSAYGFAMALGVVSVVIILLASAVQIARAYAISVFSAARVETISNRLIESYMRRRFEYFLDHHSGDLGNKILSETQVIENHLYRPLAEVVAAAASSLGIAAIVFWYSPLVALGCLFVLGSIYGLTYLLSSRQHRKMAQDRFAANHKRFRISIEALSGIKDIRILGKEQSYVDQFIESSAAVRRASVRHGTAIEIPNYILQALAFGGVIILGMVILQPEGFGSQTGLQDVLPIIGLFAFAGQRLLPEFQRIFAGVTSMQYGHVAMDAIHADLVGTPVDAFVSLEPAPQIPLEKQVTLTRVGYGYGGEKSIGLDELSLAIHKGEKIGIVGPSGAGKSTLANLLLGLITPQSGQMLVDEVEITADNARGWQGYVGYVPQDIFLTDATLKENVALGTHPEQIDTDRVWAALDAAQLTSHVNDQMPDGLDTAVGERGQKLSGGQRQRVGIARAIYHQADFLVFDEATSALDNATEREVMKAIDALPSDKTIVIIAHRLTTVRHCERILVLDKGKLAASGTWDDLMSGSEIFRDLVASQAKDHP